MRWVEISEDRLAVLDAAQSLANAVETCAAGSPVIAGYLAAWQDCRSRLAEREDNTSDNRATNDHRSSTA